MESGRRWEGGYVDNIICILCGFQAYLQFALILNNRVMIIIFQPEFETEIELFDIALYPGPFEKSNFLNGPGYEAMFDSIAIQSPLPVTSPEI